MSWDRWRTVCFWLSLLLVASGGILLRAAYDWNGYTPDECIPIAVVAHLRQAGDLDTNWALTDLREEFRYDQYNFSSYHLCLYVCRGLVELLPGTAEWLSRNDGLQAYRSFSVLMAALALMQVVWLAWRAGGRLAAVIAGALAAVCTLLVQDAYYARPETFTAVVTLGAAALCRPVERRTPVRALTAALLIGVLVACKVSMLALCWLPFVPIAARWRHLRQPVLLAAAVPFALALGFAAGAPGAVAHPTSFLNGVQVLYSQYSDGGWAHGHYPEITKCVADLVARYFVAMLGLPILIAAGIGALAVAARRQWAMLALLAGPVGLFVGYFMTRCVFFERNLSHVVPLLLVLSSLGIVALATLLLRRAPAAVPAAAAAMTMLCAIRPYGVTCQLVFDEYSGEAKGRQVQYEDEMRQQHPPLDVIRTSLIVDEQVEELAERMRATPATFLLCVTDMNDDWTPPRVQLFLRRFDAQELPDRRSTFAEFPVCTLLSYHRPNERYFLVTGLKH